MPDSDVTSARGLDRVTARVVLLFAGAFLFLGLGMVIRAVVEQRSPWAGLFVMLCAVISVVRARRRLRSP